jgi:aryl-alcohol dehydrogenase-like predicted oxidoreductase
MEYRTLGNTGTVVSTLCLGTMTFGAESDEQVAHEQLDRFLEQGGNFLDTADVYADGASETIIGRWLAARLHLSAEETARLDQASAPIVDEYPYGDLGVSQRDRGLPAPGAAT